MMSISSTPKAQRANVYSQGYRRFTGTRGGLMSSIWAVTVQSVRFILGIGRGSVPKLAPAILAVFRSLSAIFVLGFVFLNGEGITDIFGAGYAGHITGSMETVVLFTALAAPGILVGDRRNGMFDMYMTTNLTRSTYLLGKALGLLITLSGFIIIPAAVTLVGFSILGSGPDGPIAWLQTAGRIVAATLIVAMMFGSVAMALSAVSKRALLAGLGIIGVFIGGGILAAIFVSVLEYAQEWALLSVFYTAVAATDAVFGERIAGDTSAVWVWFATIAHITFPTLIVWLAYRKAGGER